MDRIFDHRPSLGVHDVFQAAKETGSHERLLKNLYSLFENSSQSLFILEFLQCMAITMTYMEKHPVVEHALDFAAKYCIYHGSLVGEEDNVLLLAVFEFILDNHNRKLAAIRYRTCEFVNRLLNKMGPQAALDDDVFDKMSSTMLERLQDRNPSIRAQAVMALQRLQDPSSVNCRILKAFSYHLEADPSCDVRVRVVQNIAVTQKTLPLLLGRLSDQKETVRRETYKALNRVNAKKYSIRQRQTILSSGVTDRSDTVKYYVQHTMLPTWFENCDSNFIEFLSMLDVARFRPEILKTVMEHLFSLRVVPQAELISFIQSLQVESSGRRVIPASDLTPEAAILWASAVSHLGFEASYTVILPELTNYAKYLSLFCDKANLEDSDHQYILKQLIEIAKHYSFMDEMGRKRLIEACTDILKRDVVGVEVIPSIVSLLELLIPNVKERMVLMNELTSDIMEPLEAADPSNGINEEGWESSADALQNGHCSQNTIDGISQRLSSLNCESPLLNDDARNEKADPETLIKCLTIIKEMLKSPSVNKVDATLFSLKEHFIIKCFNSTDGRVLSLATDCLGLLCIWSADISRDFFLKFCIQIANDAASVAALEAIFDILLVHGFEPFSFNSTVDNEPVDILGEGSALDFSRDPSLTPTTRKLVPLLAGLLKSNQDSVRVKASEGLCKLLLSSRIDSPIVFAHLILLWFSPANDREPLIRHSLGLFFSLFSSKRLGAPDIILQAFVPTLRGSEELHDELLDQNKIADFFVTLLKSDIVQKNGKTQADKGSYHAQLACIILEEMREEIIPMNILSKSLSRIQLEKSDGMVSDKVSAQILRTQRWLSRRTTDKRILSVLKKFKTEVDTNKRLYEDREERGSIKEEPTTEVRGDESVASSSCSKRATAGSTGLEDTRLGGGGGSDGRGTRRPRGNSVESTQGEETNDISMRGNASQMSLMSKPDLDVIEETSDEEENEDEGNLRKRKDSCEPEVIPESSDEMVTPSPPKRRMLRSRNK